MARFKSMHLFMLLALSLPGCSLQVRPDKADYRYRQSFIAQEDKDPLLAGKRNGGANAPSTTPTKPREGGDLAASRCRERVGWRYKGAAEYAMRNLLGACLGRDVAATTLQGQGLKLRAKQPRQGDLVLFHNTMDRNGNGSLDDKFTAAGLVVGVKGARIAFVYLRQGRAQLGWLNLSQPNRRRLGHRAAVQNSFLRQVQPEDKADTPYLAGQLLAGFATL